jgi:multiple sugar transport system substrate-binding protein
VNMKQTGITFITAMLILILTACGGNNPQGAGTAPPSSTENKAPAKSAEAAPVTLKLYIATGITDQDIQNFIVDPVKKKYPNITIEPVKPGTGTKIEDLIAANEIPELIYTWNGDLGKYYTLNLLGDIDPLAKKYNVDISKFAPEIMTSIRQVSGKNEVSGLPFSQPFVATFYNKDVFDKFGIAYPKDGMTWDEMIELSKKIARVENGVQYRGFDSDQLGRMSEQFGVAMVDGKTNKASVNNDSWKRLFETAKAVWSISNNQPPQMMTFNGAKWFTEDKNVGMIATASYILASMESAEKNGLHWDMVTYPAYKDKPNQYRYVESHLIAITNTGKHQDEAMQALSVIMSEENQTKMVRTTAKMSTLANPAINKQLGTEVSYLKGKNVANVIKDAPLPAPIFSKNEGDARTPVWDSFKKYYNGEVDVNTALKEADEQVNAMLASKK